MIEWLIRNKQIFVGYRNSRYREQSYPYCWNKVLPPILWELRSRCWWRRLGLGVEIVVLHQWNLVKLYPPELPENSCIRVPGKAVPEELTGSTSKLFEKLTMPEGEPGSQPSFSCTVCLASSTGQNLTVCQLTNEKVPKGPRFVFADQVIKGKFIAKRWWSDNWHRKKKSIYLLKAFILL